MGIYFGVITGEVSSVVPCKSPVLESVKVLRLGLIRSGPLPQKVIWYPSSQRGY